MSTEIALYAPPTTADIDRRQPPTTAPAPTPVLDAWLAGRKATTVRAYQSDLGDFARSLGMTSPVLAVELLLIQGAGPANELVLGYRAAMLARNLSAATINRRIAALRSLTKLARTLGRIGWAVEIEGPKPEPRKDTRGPDRAGFMKLCAAARKVEGRKGARDRALIALLHDLALRRGEVLALDLADVDLSLGLVLVVGKGRREKQGMTLPDPTRRALAEWIEARGPEAGPLFVRLDKGASFQRLDGRGLARELGKLGKAAKLDRPVRPHGLRHAAITAALDSGHDIRSVRKFSRHAKLETVLKYDDARGDVAGDIARSVAGKRR